MLFTSIFCVNSNIFLILRWWFLTSIFNWTLFEFLNVENADMWQIPVLWDTLLLVIKTCFNFEQMKIQKNSFFKQTMSKQRGLCCCFAFVYIICLKNILADQQKSCLVCTKNYQYILNLLHTKFFFSGTPYAKCKQKKSLVIIIFAMNIKWRNR